MRTKFDGDELTPEEVEESYNRAAEDLQRRVADKIAEVQRDYAIEMAELYAWKENKDRRILILNGVLVDNFKLSIPCDELTQLADLNVLIDGEWRYYAIDPDDINIEDNKIRIDTKLLEYEA